MYKVLFSNRFEKDIAICIKRGLKAEKLYNAIELLRQTGSLPAKYKPHKISGKYKGG